ncbi:MAG: right-handed parallel beta-helix repeat-containing protein, partial [Methanothrix sp.]|nr:right-handed parallel beta-helix repeat-containing protein [Methanothrix sp.]
MIAVSFLLAATVMVLPLLSSVHAATISVGPDGGYLKVQEAVDAAEPGDIILVQNGTYRESVHVTKELLILGIDRPIVDAMGNDNAFLIESGEIMLKGFVVLNSSDIGIKLLSDNNIIISNRVSGHDYAGIGLAGSNGNILSGNELMENGIYGIYLIDAARNTLKRNYANKSGNSGFELVESDYNDISGNIVSDNKNDGIELKSSENNTINGNVALMNKDGICLEGGSKNNLIVQNNVTGNDIDGIL